MLLSGCLNSARYTLDTDFDSSPVKSSTKLTDALRCLGAQLKASPQNPGAYAFMVRDIVDGTVDRNKNADGPLADAGRIQMISILSAHTRPSYGVVTDEFPLMLRPTVNEQLGLNRFGLPSTSNLKTYVSMLTQISNADRQSIGMGAVNSVVPLIIDGAFTRYDSSHIRSRGYGQNAGYRGDDGDEESISIDRGSSGSERSVTLVVNIIDPKTNVVVGTEGFDLKFYSNSKTARFRVAVDEYYYGFSNTDVQVETIHAAQQILLEAGAIWILDNAYGNMVDFSACFNTEATLALGQDARYERVKAEQLGQQTGVTLAQTATHEVVATAAPTPEVVRNVVDVLEQSVEFAAAQPMWHVRVGAFAKPENVAAFSEELSKRGYAARTTSVRVSSGEATRIWLGPYANKKTAQEICTKLADLTGQSGYVVLQR